MKLLISVFISLLFCGLIRAPQDVAQHTAAFHKSIQRINEMIYYDTEIRIQIIQKYMRMWKLSIYFEIGLIGAALRTHFRYMLKLYRYHSNPRLLQYKGYLGYPLYWRYNAFGWNIEHWSRGFVMILLEYNKILGNIREFNEAVKKYLVQQRYWRKVRAQATYIHGWGRLRRQGGGDALGPGLSTVTTSTTTLPDEEYETDYFGHRFRKGQKFPVGYVNLKKQEDSMWESEKAVKELLGWEEDEEDDMNFTHINEWIKYMKETGIEKNIQKEKKQRELKKKQEMAKKQQAAKHKAEIKPKVNNQQTKNKITAKNDEMTRKQNKGKIRDPTVAKTQNAAPKPAGNQKALKNQKTLKDLDQGVQKKHSPNAPKSQKPPALQIRKLGQRDSDFEYKARMRQKFADQMRGNFDPEREGIPIDLSGLD